MESETAEQRESRLQQLATNRQQRLESETAEQRESRLQQLATNRQQRLESETAEQRESRLQQLATNRQQRLESETAEQRESRLQQLATNRQQRLESETAEQRESRLQQLAMNRQQRLESEMPEQRESRQQQNRQSQREARARDLQLPLFHQQSVRSKMANFHDKIGTLQVSMCSTCSEKFPGVKVKSTGGMLECVRCSHDRHVPKLYSSSNNMHPGLVPPELQVSFCSSL